MHICKKSICRSLLSITAAAAVLSWGMPFQRDNTEVVSAADTSVVANPVIWSDVPDEDVIRVGDTYYMVSTTMFFSPGAPIMKSKDLVSWEICSYVYDTLSDGNKQTLTGGEHDYAHGQWAASLRYHDGNFYVFFGSYGTGKSYIYKTNDIENGTWTRSEIPGMYHDASILFDDDGRNYLVYGGGGEIRIKELNAEMTGFKNGGAEKVLFKTGLDNLAGEGSHIQKIGDYYYVFVIAWPSTSGRIELCYRSRDLLGTYEGKTVLNSGVGTYGSGVAQGGIVDTPDGKWYGMLFQDHGAVGRIPVLVPVTWENGWPMMGVNGKVPVTFEIEGVHSGTFLAKDDDFSYSSDKLALEWQWNHNPDNTAWTVTERPGYLRLKNNTIATNLLNARNTLTQRTEGPACSSVIKLDTKGMKTGDYAGLSAFQYNYGNVGVYVADDGSKKIYMAENGIVASKGDVKDSYNKIVEETSLSGDEIYLKVDFRFNNVDENMNVSYNIDKANFYYSYDGTDWKKIGNELSMTYDLKLFTGYRSGIYSYATKNTGGYADIDFFDYERADWNQPTEIKPNEFGWYFSCSFEGSTDELTGRGPAKVESSGDESYVGSNSLYVYDRTSPWNGACKKLSTSVFKPGTEYSFSSHVKYTEGGLTDTFYMKLQYTDSEGNTQYSTIAESKAVKGEWVQLVNTNYMIPEDASDMYIYIETADSTNSFYVDELIGAVGGTGIAGEGSLDFEIIPGDVNCDGSINIFDLCAAKTGLTVGFENKIQQAAADVDGNGEADTTDLQLIQKYIGSVITEFPVGEPENSEN
ncbi:MAG: family 43 glycosylhydrolase [Oscillospiraceae bacterium]|nr:family 43 glycosylhydrolase [Oscillospiraceae bacterium]